MKTINVKLKYDKGESIRGNVVIFLSINRINYVVSNLLVHAAFRFVGV